MATNFGLFQSNKSGLFQNKQTSITIPPSSWHKTQDSMTVDIKLNEASAVVNNATITTPVILPHGVTVTSFIVYGGESTRTATFQRVPINTNSQVTITQATVNSVVNFNEDIDNNTFTYGLIVSGMQSAETIQGTVITFTRGNEDT